MSDLNMYLLFKISLPYKTFNNILNIHHIRIQIVPEVIILIKALN
jgi:hypothetical protein